MFGQLWVGVKGGVWKQAADGAWSGESGDGGGLLTGPSTVGLLMGRGGSPCHMSIFLNSNVACLCRLFSTMSHVEF